MEDTLNAASSPPSASPLPTAVELARALVRVPSVNPELEEDGAGEAAISRLTMDWLASWGFESRREEVAPGRWNVVATHPPGGASSGASLLFNGHLDTVGVRGMTVAPFDAPVADDRVVGRGACDMKGGVAALLRAAAALARDGHGGELQVALTADEEHASLGMQALVAGGVRADAAVVCEPTELAVMPAHKGFAWVRVAFRGRAAHGSRPEIGIDANRRAALYVAELEDLERRLAGAAAHPLLGRPSFHVGLMRGGSAPSVYADRCEVVLERRTLPGEAPDDVYRDFERALESLGERLPRLEAQLERMLHRPGTEVPVDSTLVQGLLAAASLEGIEPKVLGMTAWVDAAYLNEAGIPAVCFGPGSIARAHTEDEWVPNEDVERCARTLERFGRDFLGRP